MTLAVGSLLDQTTLLLGRAIGLEEAAVAALGRIVTIVAVLVLGWVAYRILFALIHRLLRRLESGPDLLTKSQRARTLGPLLSSVARYLVAFIVGVVILQELGVDVRALVVSAGVVGLAVGFGAQSLIKDVLMGFFLLFENLVAVGDVIEVGTHAGVVEAVGLRVTKIRKFSGELRIVPNGELTAFSLHSAGWGRAIVEVGIPSDQDVTRALGVLEGVGRAFHEAHRGVLLDPPVTEGILRFGEPATTVVRIHARVNAQRKGHVELELHRRVREAFDAAGIPRPYPHVVVHLDPESTRLPTGRGSPSE